TSRSYLQILWQNAFTLINVLLVGVCSVLIWMHRLDDAVLTGGLVGMNVLVGVVQEGRAKRHLDHIALLTRPTSTVVREGRERVGVPPGEDPLAARCRHRHPRAGVAGEPHRAVAGPLLRAPPHSARGTGANRRGARLPGAAGPDRPDHDYLCPGHGAHAQEGH